MHGAMCRSAPILIGAD